MKVLVCGAGGFIGQRIARTLRADGHTVREGRSPEFNYARDLDVATWLPRIEGMDAVVNAVGVLRDSRARPMNAVHHLAPAALFRACAEAGLRRVIQVSALGIDANPTLYARSKLQAEAALRQLHEEGRLAPTILRPSIVFGRGGASSQLFMGLARLPVLMLPAAALRAKVQPVAVNDLTAVCASLLNADTPLQLDCVGPRALTLSDFIASLRQQLGHKPARVLPLPDWLSRASAVCGDYIPSQPWCTESLTLLQKDNVGNSEAFAALLAQPAVWPEDLVATAWNT